jgi:hypothetical protein
MRKLRLVLLSFILIFSMWNIARTAAQSVPAWQAGVAFSVGQQVTYQDATHPNHLYKCLQAHTSLTGWEPPNVPALWQDLGAYSGGATNTPTTAKTNTPTKTNTPIGATATPTVRPPTATNMLTLTNTHTAIAPTATKTSAGPTPTTSSIPAWNCNNSYATGAQVTYNGHIFQALVNIPANECGWIPGSTPTVWQDNGAIGNNTPTFVPPTATTAGPTAPATQGATAVGAPAKPVLSVSAVTGSNDYDVTWNIWYGTNATSWQLLENGVSIYSASIVANSPNVQTGTYRVSGKQYGAYSYQVIVTNTAGSTTSDPVLYTVGGASKIYLPAYDSGRQALQITVPQGTTDLSVTLLGSASASFSLSTNNSTVIGFQMLNASTIRLQGLQAGRAGLKITDSVSGETRYVGVRVKTAAGANPGMPTYFTIGSESEDIPGDLTFWRSYATDQTNKRIDIRYIYLNTGWRSPGSSSLNVDGGRLISFLRESLKMGIIPFFVYYNIPSGGESYSTDLGDMQNTSYMQGYYTDLKFALDTIRAEAGDELFGFVMEPDFIGYMMQNSNGRTPTPATQLMAATSAVYSSGVLSGSDPSFPNTLAGLVQSVNYTIHKYGTTPYFGWEFSLWASPGITIGIPSTGLMRLTDSMGISAGRQALVTETNQIVNYYMTAGVTSYSANFVSVDKYGYDAGSSSPDNPTASTWFWNADHWNNYLLFASTLHTGSGLPVILWQIPQGHINTSQASDPYPGSGGVFPALPNTSTKYEDSAPTFFLGDTFTPGSSTRFSYFATNQGGDSAITSAGSSTVTWGSHIAAAKASGVISILFGPGVGDSTDGVGTPAADSYWWITAVQRYYSAPVSLP